MNNDTTNTDCVHMYHIMYLLFFVMKKLHVFHQFILCINKKCINTDQDKSAILFIFLKFPSLHTTPSVISTARIESMYDRAVTGKIRIPSEERLFALA